MHPERSAKTYSLDQQLRNSNAKTNNLLAVTSNRIILTGA